MIIHLQRVQWSIFRGYVIVSLPKGRRVGTCSPLKIGQVPKKKPDRLLFIKFLGAVAVSFTKGTQISASCFASGIPEFEVVPIAGHYEETNAAMARKIFSFSMSTTRKSKTALMSPHPCFNVCNGQNGNVCPNRGEHIKY